MERRTYVSALAALGVLFVFNASAQEHFHLNSAFKYSGRATGLEVTQVQAGGASNTLTVADSGPTPVTGGEVHNFLSDSGTVPNVMAQDLDAVSIGDGGETRTQTWMAHLDARLGTHRITALWVESTAFAAGTGPMVPATGKCNVEGLTVDGLPVAVSGATNQTVELSDGRLVINEQSGVSSAHFGSMTVNALHLYVTGSGSMVAASSKAEIIRPNLVGVVE